MQVPDAARRYDLSSVRVCTGGGESLGAETYQRWKEMFGLEIYEGLGTTEMMYVFVSSAVTRRVKPGAIGPAVPGYELKVLGEDGARRAGGRGRPPGRPRADRHRLLARSGQAARERCATAGAARATSSRWTRTATSGSCPARTTSSSPPATGSAPRRWRTLSPATPRWPTSASSASPTPCGARTRAPTSCSSPGRRPSDALRRELIEFCRDKIAVYKLPREIEFVPQLPRAPGPAGPGTGKLLRRVLREQAARG